jgi:hypothetical protein
MTLSESRQKKEDQRQAIAETQTQASTMNAIQATQYIAKQLESRPAVCNAKYESSGMTLQSKNFKKTFPFATSRFEEEKLQAGRTEQPQ